MSFGSAQKGTGIPISGITPGGQAASNGKVARGHIIVALDGADCRNMNVEAMCKLFKGKDTLEFTMVKGEK